MIVLNDDLALNTALPGLADFLSGAVRVLTIEDPKAFVAGGPPPQVHGEPANPAAARIMTIMNDAATISARLRQTLVGPNRFNGWFDQGSYLDPFGAQTALLEDHRGRGDRACLQDLAHRLRHARRSARPARSVAEACQSLARPRPAPGYRPDLT